MMIKLNSNWFKKINNIQTVNKFRIVIYNAYKIIKKNVIPVLVFIKMLIRYLISKYYYKLCNIDFVIAARYDRQVFEFFITFNKLKAFILGDKPQKKLWVSMAFYYLIMLGALLLYAPITWFLLKVLTDPQNWMIYYLDHINLGLAL